MNNKKREQIEKAIDGVGDMCVVKGTFESRTVWLELSLQHESLIGGLSFEVKHD